MAVVPRLRCSGIQPARKYSKTQGPHTANINFLGTNLTKNAQNLYRENFETLRKGRKDYEYIEMFYALLNVKSVNSTLKIAKFIVILVKH